MRKYRFVLAGYSLVVQITGILLCSIFGSLFAGLWLDKKLGTKPCLMFVLMILGIVFAFYMVYRTVNEPPSSNSK